MEALVTNLTPTSRVWVYQCNRQLNDSQKEDIASRLDAFTKEWDSHGARLTASFDIIYDQFIVIAVDEQLAGASGCSIDKSVAVIKEIDTTYDLGLLDRSQIAARINGSIEVLPLSDIKKRVSSGDITSETTIYNNAITTLGELQSNWEVPASSSWMNRYF